MDLFYKSSFQAVLLSIGLQGKSTEALTNEFNMPMNQVLAKFYDMMKKVTKYIASKIEGHIESTMINERELDRGEKLQPITKSFSDELDEDAAVWLAITSYDH